MDATLNSPTARTPLAVLGCLFAAVAAVAMAGPEGPGRGDPAVDRITAPKAAGDRLIATVRPPDLIAVRFHHDRCPFCKMLEPEYARLVRETSPDSVLFVTLDLSTAGRQNQAALLVAALGLESVWPGDYTKLGTVTFVDGRTRRILSTYRTADETPLEEALRLARALVPSGN